MRWDLQDVRQLGPPQLPTSCLGHRFRGAAGLCSSALALAAAAGVGGLHDLVPRSWHGDAAAAGVGGLDGLVARIGHELWFAAAAAFISGLLGLIARFGHEPCGNAAAGISSLHDLVARMGHGWQCFSAAAGIGGLSSDVVGGLCHERRGTAAAPGVGGLEDLVAGLGSQLRDVCHSAAACSAACSEVTDSAGASAYRAVAASICTAVAWRAVLTHGLVAACGCHSRVGHAGLVLPGRMCLGIGL